MASTSPEAYLKRQSTHGHKVVSLRGQCIASVLNPSVDVESRPASVGDEFAANIETISKLRAEVQTGRDHMS